MMLAAYVGFPHNERAADTNAAWFSSQNVPGRTTASRRYFYVRTQLRAFFGRAIAGRAHALPVPLDAGLLTLLSARPPHLAVGGGVTPSKEATMAPSRSRASAANPVRLIDSEIITPLRNALAALGRIRTLVDTTTETAELHRSAHYDQAEAEDALSRVADLSAITADVITDLVNYLEVSIDILQGDHGTAYVDSAQVDARMAGIDAGRRIYRKGGRHE